MVLRVEQPEEEGVDRAHGVEPQQLYAGRLIGSAVENGGEPHLEEEIKVLGGGVGSEEDQEREDREVAGRERCPQEETEEEAVVPESDAVSYEGTVVVHL